LRILYQPDESISIHLPRPLSENGSPTQHDDSTAITPITFEIIDGQGKEHEFKPEFAPAGFKIKAVDLTSLAAFYPSSFASTINPSEAAQQFSELSKSNRAQDLIKVVQKVFPGIKNLSVESFSGVWMLHCGRAGLREKVPLGLVSSGIHKLISLLLGISSQEKGVVLIDELDNGFYYKALPQVWQAIYQFANDFGVQVFASTHSQECLRAIAPTIKRNVEDFRLLRLEVRGGKHVARVFGGKNLKAALETETEVR
jgi:hypothetical protein